MNKDFNISRRDFLKTLTLAGFSVSSLAGCLSSTSNQSPQTSVIKDNADKSTVVIARSEKLADPDPVVIKQMLNIAVPQALGMTSAIEAWRTLFKPNDTVGIKVNCIAPKVSSHPKLARAVADSLITVG
ncbi:twin-arginine translocation signal domain-containing protein, partial [Candidatus Poribacteria bacterium]|nr:twin-arginine translocation signal domain-containing protein [Candidatus Poribacteria bacterium]